MARKASGLLSLLTAGAVMLSLSSEISLAQEPDIVVGILVPTTGSEAASGKDMENAINLAADEINANGGVLGRKLKTVTGDDACDPQQGVNAASKLVASGVVAVVGGYCSTTSISEMKALEGIPFVITASNSTKLIDENPGNGFMINGTLLDQVNDAVKLFNSKGVKKLAILHQGEPYSVDFAERVRAKWLAEGNEVVSYDVINRGEQDFSALITKMKQQASDGVLWPGYYSEGGLLVKQLKQSGYGGAIVLGDGSNSPKFFELAGSAAGEGVYCLSNPIVDLIPEAKQFRENFEKKYQIGPSSFSALSYDGMYLLADAIKRAGEVDKAKITAALKATESFHGLSGPVTFKPDNSNAESSFAVLVGKQGRWALQD